MVWYAYIYCGVWVLLELSLEIVYISRIAMFSKVAKEGP